MIAHDKRSTNQNSGVRIDAIDPNGNKETYYGRIEEIWELDYVPYFKVPLFRCQWVRVTRGGDLNNFGYIDEPFVLAKDVNQVFYVKDMSTKPNKGKNNNVSDNEPKCHIVLLGKRNIRGIKDRSDMSEDYEKNDKILPFTMNSDPSVLLNDEDTPWLWHDHNQGTYVKKKFVAVPA
jgi:hypothetical protein